MFKKIIGATVGTTINPNKVLKQGEDEIAFMINKALQEAKDSGEFDGVGISEIAPKIERNMTTHEESVVGFFIILTDGRMYEFDLIAGKDGEDGKDYILTDQDKQDIADIIGASIVDGNEVAY